MARKLNSLLIITVALLTALVNVSTAKNIHTVGDALGWTIPSDGSKTYTEWAASKTLVLGDILVFEFMNGVHDVTQVTKSDFKDCNANNPIRRITESPAKIFLNATGEHHYVCGFPGHCDAGQKLAITVLAKPPSPSTLQTPPPTFSPSLPPSPQPHPQRRRRHRRQRHHANSPMRSPMIFTVGDEMGWAIPPNVTAYQAWASGKSFMVGDVLVFNYRNGSHDVVEVTRQSFDSCTAASAGGSPLSHSTEPPTNITLTTAGPHFFLCTVPSHCDLGQRLAINVACSSGALPPSSAMPPLSSGQDVSSTTAPPPRSSATRLGGSSAILIVLVVGFW